jgi:hypothetical protein
MTNARGRLWIACLLLTVLTGAGAAIAQEEPKPKAAAEKEPEKAELQPTWYAQALAHSDKGGLNVTDFWAKKNLMRAETVVRGRRIVTIIRGPAYIAFDRIGRVGVAIQRSPKAVAQDTERSRPFGNELEALIRRGAENVGSERLGGRKVDAWRITDQLGRREVWVTQDEFRLPLRVEIFLRGSGDTAVTDFLGWQRGMVIPDVFFFPDTDIELTEISYEKYLEEAAKLKPIGSVPVLYDDLLHGY